MTGIVLTGDKALDRAFAQFPPKLRRKMARKGLRKAARVVLEDARSSAAQISDDLARLLKLKSQRMQDKDTVGVSVRTTDTAYTDEGTVLNPHWFEFGAPGHLAWGQGSAPLAPRPFLRPAMDNNRTTVKGVFQLETRKAINQVAAELRRS